jgi:hypothetical protein
MRQAHFYGRDEKKPARGGQMVSRGGYGLGGGATGAAGEIWLGTLIMMTGPA